MKWGTYADHQAHVNQLYQQAENDRLIKEALAAQQQARLAGYLERITSFWHEKNHRDN